MWCIWHGAGGCTGHDTGNESCLTWGRADGIVGGNTGGNVFGIVGDIALGMACSIALVIKLGRAASSVDCVWPVRG
jgi:hypothetical protein